MKKIIIEEFDFSTQEKIVVETHGKSKQYIYANNIKYLICEKHYTTIFLANETSVLEREYLKTYEIFLTDHGFFRISHNTIINGKFISSMILKKEEKKVFLGEKMFVFSRNKLNKLKKSKIFIQVMTKFCKL
jgi:DNA-binding LytR/AlgR family response regulator